MKKVNKHFVSDIDRQLAAFDQTQSLSDSQKAEIEKYNRIFELRDNPDVTHEDQGDIWS